MTDAPPAHGDDLIGAIPQPARAGGRTSAPVAGWTMRPIERRGHEFGLAARDFAGVHRGGDRTADHLDRIALVTRHMAQKAVLAS